MEPEKIKNRKRIKRVIFCIFLIVLVLILIYLWKEMQRLSVGKRITRIQEDVPVEAPKKIEYQNFEGKYVGFRLPDSFVLKSYQDVFNGQEVFLESAFFADQEMYSSKVTLTVENMIGRTLQESANYNFRVKNPKKYLKEKEDMGDFSAISFFFQEGGLYEKVFFVQKKDLLAQIALTSANRSKDILDKELRDIVQSLKWKE